MRFLRFGSARVRGAFGVAVVAYGFVGVLSVTGHAGQARSVTDGVYSAAQATRGQQLYKDQCLPCHGENLEGVVGPALTGNDFTTNWAGATLAQLVQKIQSTMPQQAPGTLTQAQSIDLSAYLLQAGKFPAGAELTAATMGTVNFPGAAAAPATAPAATPGVGSVQFPVVQNLAQLMRAVTFPNANIVFNTQVKDPGQDKGKPPVPFDYVLWGQVAYHGWQQVDQAAMTLQETSPLFLLPGRKCQNGRPVPVGKADFQKYTQDLIDFAKEVQKVALTRNVEAVSALSEKLNDVCASCHKVYRDVQPAGAPQSSSAEGGIIADRCKQ